MNEIAFNAEAQAILSKLDHLPAEIGAAIASALDAENQLTITHIQTQRLAGQGPFPASEGRLGERSTHLRGAATRTNAVVQGNVVDSSIGDPVRYAVLHEFGGEWTTKPGKVRLRTNAKGELLRQPGGRGAVFGARYHRDSRIREVAFAGGTKVEMPARAPFQRGIEDRKSNYTAAISAAIVNTWGAN